MTTSPDRPLTEVSRKNIDPESIDNEYADFDLLNPDDPIQQFLNSTKNRNTMRKTDACTNRFCSWIKASHQENRPLTDIPPQTLDRYVSTYLMQVKKMNGDDYEPDTLTSIHRAINRKLEEEGYKFSLIRSEEFSTSKKVLEARGRELKKAGKGNQPNKADALTENDEERLWPTGQLGFASPEQLINTVWFFNTKLLGFRGSHESRQLKWGDVSLVEGETGEKHIEFNERETKTRTGNSTHLRPFKPKMFRNPTNPDRCPIRAYELYASKRPIDIMKPSDPFYLAVNAKVTTPSAPWFKRSPMGHDRISAFMPRMAKAAALIGKKTNHSVRRTMCTKLFQSGVPPTMIAQLSGHKNVQSLSHYATASYDQQCGMCNILQGTATSLPSGTLPPSNRAPLMPLNLNHVAHNNNVDLRPTESTSACSNPLSHEVTRNVSMMIARPDVCDTDSDTHSHPHQSQVANSRSLSSGLFSGAIFNGNVTININN